MPFNSLLYLFFLAVTALVFARLKSGKAQQIWLLLAGCLFVGYFSWASLTAILLITAGNYILMKRYNGLPSQRSKNILFYSMLFLNGFLLLGYKFLQEFLGWNEWLLLGMGFYILQHAGNWIALHFAGYDSSRQSNSYFLSVLFFPKIPSGPLLSAKDVALFQPGEKYITREKDVVYAVNRITLGLVKKMVIADRLLPFVQEIFDKHTALSVFDIYLGSILFTVQLYADFSGYIDIALGSARLFGISLPENFQLPLRAQSVTDFWRKWHITLVAWLRNNVFQPVSFAYRKSTYGLLMAIGVTFLVSAFWHGLAITFFIWALLHFIYLTLEKKSGAAGKKGKNFFGKLIRAVIVLNLVSVAHFFFRAGNWDGLTTLLQQLAELPPLLPEGATFKTWLINGGRYIEDTLNVRLGMLLAAAWIIFEPRINKSAKSEELNIAYSALMFFLLLSIGIFDAGERFIYMQF